MPSEVSDRQQRIREDLSAEIDGEVRVEPLDRMLYASDGSLYQIMPTAVAYPTSHDDVVTLVRYAAAEELPVTCRGSGSGVAGGCLGEGLVLDFSRSMRRVVDVDASSRTARVEAGVVRDALNRHLKPDGLYFGPDPANAPVTTYGSMIALDAAGSHRIRYGSTRDHVRVIRGVTGDGHEFEARRDGIAFCNVGGDNVDEPRHDPRLRSLLRRESATIETAFAGRPAAASGYSLDRVLGSDTSIDYVRLLCGSEGTLAAITEVEIDLVPLATSRHAIMMLFRNVEHAIEAALSIRSIKPDACDLLDRRLLGVARESVPGFSSVIPENAECVLLIDVLGTEAEDVSSRMASIKRSIRRSDPTAKIAIDAPTLEQAASLWTLPGRVLPLLTRLSGNVRPLPFVEDLLIPPDRLLEFMPKARRVFQRHDTTASFQSHVLTGQVHLRPLLPIPRTAAESERLEGMARDLYEVVFAHSGTVSGEHGDGLSRTAFLRSRFGPLYPVFREVKQIFDPKQIMNPGKIVSNDPHLTIKHLRCDAVSSRLNLQLLWPSSVGTTADTDADGDQSFAGEANRCTGCGECRRTDDRTRMCPVLEVGVLEDNSPRSKANAIRGMLDGTLDASTLSSPEMRLLSERCFNCKQCVIDCPTHVDIPHLMIEAKAAAYGQHGLSRVDWFLCRAHSLGQAVSPLAPAVNAALATGAIRWLLEKAIGLALERRLPKFARRPFLKSIRGERFEPTSPSLSGGQQEVVYFVDHFANFHDLKIAAATVSVLRHNGFTVHVPKAQLPSGMAMISAGDLEAAREVALENVQVLGPLADEGYRVICSEPSAAIALTDDYPRLIDHPDTAAVAKQTTEVGTFLAEQLDRGNLRTDFGPVDIDLFYHTPCHTKAIAPDRPFLKLLSLIPELNVRDEERGCSGMAGAYGLSRRHFDDSVRIGRDLIREVRTMSEHAGVTECSSCGIQMMQGATKPTVHPIKIIAESYGLLTSGLQSRESVVRKR